MELYSKRRALATTVTLSGKCYDSSARSADDLIIRNFHVWKTTNPPRLERAADASSEKAETFYGNNAWSVKGHQVRAGTVSTVQGGENVRVPEETSMSGWDGDFDLELALDFNIDPEVDSAIQYALHGMFWYLDNPAGSPEEYDVTHFTDIRHHSYQTGTWSADYTGGTGNEGASVECMRDYLLDLYRMPRHILERTYDDMRATDASKTSQAALMPSIRMSINQGDASRTFYAKRVTKNISENTATIEWLEE